MFRLFTATAFRASCVRQVGLSLPFLLLLAVVALPANADDSPSSHVDHQPPATAVFQLDVLPAVTENLPAASEDTEDTEEPVDSETVFAPDGGEAESNSDSHGSVFQTVGFLKQPAFTQSQVYRPIAKGFSWMAADWSVAAEFGIDGSSGNSDTLAMQTGIDLKRANEFRVIEIDVAYRNASNTGIRSENNGRFNWSYERLHQNTAWSAFAKASVEWDQFKAFDSRLNMNAGLGYDWIREDKRRLTGRLGAGASREFGGPDDSWTPEAVASIEGFWKINGYNEINGKLEYFPSWNDLSDYRVVSEANWDLLLTADDALTLRLSITDRYDSTPQGARPNDFYYTALLRYKF